MGVGPRVGFLGAGRMAAALARGWVAAGLIDPDGVLAGDPLPRARESFTSGTPLRTTTSNLEVVAHAELLVLAVKPQSMPELLAEIRPHLLGRHLIVSVAAGVPLRRLAEGLAGHARLVRVMPNTPCLVGASASAYSPAEGATAADVELVDRLLNAVGRAFRLPENLLDAVTGLSGSGPGFVCLVIEALADGGVRVGLAREVALVLAAQTVLGSARMVLETGSHPAALKDMVASPGGTTMAGLHALESGGVRGALIDAVVAATRRAVELGQAKTGL